MKINYKRDITKSFMCITCEDEWSSYEKELLSRQKIGGLLEVNVTSEDSKAVCWYDITGKQALDEVLENKCMKKEMLVQLLICLSSMLEQLESYLLCADAVRLDPECIYLNYKNSKYEFCYHPQSAENITDEFQKLMEFLLTKIDHSDEEAVKAAYQIYNECMKPGYSILAIREELCVDKTGQEYYPAQNETKVQSEKAFSEELDTKPEAETPKRQGAQADDKITRVKQMFSPETIKNKIDDTCRQIMRKFLPDIFKIKEKKVIRIKQEQIQPIVFEPEEEQIENARPTVLLSEQSVKLCGILKYEGGNCQKDLRIDKLPYIIGKSDECDGKIESGTVSRQHARITKADSIYFIQDLNSSNGTTVGGKLLDYKTKVSLERNEIVEFADEKFRFI